MQKERQVQSIKPINTYKKCLCCGRKYQATAEREKCLCGGHLYLIGTVYQLIGKEIERFNIHRCMYILQKNSCPPVNGATNPETGGSRKGGEKDCIA